MPRGQPFTIVGSIFSVLSTGARAPTQLPADLQPGPPHPLRLSNSYPRQRAAAPTEIVGGTVERRSTNTHTSTHDFDTKLRRNIMIACASRLRTQMDHPPSNGQMSSRRDHLPKRGRRRSSQRAPRSRSRLGFAALQSRLCCRTTARMGSDGPPTSICLPMAPSCDWPVGVCAVGRSSDAALALLSAALSLRVARRPTVATTTLSGSERRPSQPTPRSARV